jgi:membrane-associated phospholipid phosphatase
MPSRDPFPAKLFPRSLARLALAVGICLVGYAVLANRAANNDVYAWDTRLSQRIHDFENRETLWNRYVDLFDIVLSVYVQAALFALAAVVILLLIRTGRRGEAVFAGVGLAGATVIAVVAKVLVAQPPVDAGGNEFAFPSGHAARSMAAAAVFAALAWETRWRKTILAAGSVFVVLMGIALVYNEWHLVSDVLGGWFLSLAWLGSVALAMSVGTLARGRPRH